MNNAPEATLFATYAFTGFRTAIGVEFSYSSPDSLSDSKCS